VEGLDETGKHAIESQNAYIANETLADEIGFMLSETDFIGETVVNGQNLRIGLSKR
jgi:hypothetical protein